MKKYIAPSVKMVKIENNVILAGSVTTYDEVGNGTQLGRGHRGTLTGWDDED